jgi:hypothetical protein
VIETEQLKQLKADVGTNHLNDDNEAVTQQMLVTLYNNYS